MVGNDLPKCQANYAPLTPFTFIQRAAAVFPDRLSVIYGHRRCTWAQTLQRCHRIASALSSHGLSSGDTVEKQNRPTAAAAPVGDAFHRNALPALLQPLPRWTPWHKRTQDLGQPSQTCAAFGRVSGRALRADQMLFRPPVEVGSDLPKCEANYAPLTPITFIQRAAAVFPDRLSVIYGQRSFTWAQTLQRCRRIASALSSHGLSPGDTVSVVAPNVPALYELHFAVPIAGAVLNAINYRLDARTTSLLLGHSEAKLVFVDTEFLPLVYEALSAHFSPTSPKPLVVHIKDEAYDNFAGVTAGEFGNYLDYEDFLRGGDPTFEIRWPKDEWDTIAINYTSGTTAAPKGVVFHHRGAYLHSLSAVLGWGMKTGPIYLWTLPMFHSNGWGYAWGVAAQAGTNICLRHLSLKGVFDAIHEHRVTHLCGAPTVLNMLANAEAHERKTLPHQVAIATAGSPPVAANVAKLEAQGFAVTHGYGMTEVYGIAVWCVWKEDWDGLALDERAQLKCRQGLAGLTVPVVDVVDSKTMAPVPRDGRTIGEVVLQGHSIMKGYLKAQRATQDAFKGGVYHTGDLGVMHPDGYLQLKDRSKDIIISGGENISSIELESILYKHPQILEAAVVARPDDFWGETPCAFINLKTSATSAISEKSLIEWCRQNMPHYMVPRSVIFGDLPKTLTGKVQKNVLRERAKSLGSVTSMARSKV